MSADATKEYPAGDSPFCQTCASLPASLAGHSSWH